MTSEQDGVFWKLEDRRNTSSTITNQQGQGLGTPNPIDRNTALLKIHLISRALSGSQPSTASLNFLLGVKGGC